MPTTPDTLTPREPLDSPPLDYAAYSGSIPRLGNTVVEVLTPFPGERILDLGCGDGTLTLQLIDAGAVVVGIDASEARVAAARANGIDAYAMDAHELTFEREFDAVFSHAALHWMRDPARVIDGVARALKPGGRFVGEFGGHGNVAAVMTALFAATEAENIETDYLWFFPTADEYAALLQNRGFVVTSIALTAHSSPLPLGGIKEWLHVFAKPLPFLSNIAPERRDAVLQRMERLLSYSLKDSRGQWIANYVRLRFSAYI